MIILLEPEMPSVSVWEIPFLDFLRIAASSSEAIAHPIAEWGNNIFTMLDCLLGLFFSGLVHPVLVLIFLWE